MLVFIAFFACIVSMGFGQTQTDQFTFNDRNSNDLVCRFRDGPHRSKCIRESSFYGGIDMRGLESLMGTIDLNKGAKMADEHDHLMCNGATFAQQFPCELLCSAREEPSKQITLNIVQAIIMPLFALLMITATVSICRGRDPVDQYHVVPTLDYYDYDETNKACQYGSKCVYEKDFHDAINDTTFNRLTPLVDLGKGLKVINLIKQNHDTTDFREIIVALASMVEAIQESDDRITVANIVTFLTNLFKTTDCAFIVDYVPLFQSFFQPLFKDCPT